MHELEGKIYPFGQLIDYEGKNLQRIEQFAHEHEGQLIFAKLKNNRVERYFVYANSVRMDIPSIDQLIELKQYVGNLPKDENGQPIYAATNIVEYIQQMCGWDKIEREGDY